MGRIKISPLASIFLGKNGRNVWAFLTIMIPNLLAAVLEGVSFVCILIAFSRFAEDDQAAASIQQVPFLEVFSSSFSSLSPFQALIFWILIAIALQAIRSSVAFFSSYLTSRLSLRVQTETQTRVYSQIFRLSFPCVNKYRLGDLAEYAKTPSTFIAPFMHSINGIVSSSLMSLVSVGLMFKLSMKLTLVTMAVFIVVYSSQKFIIRKIIEKSKHLSELMADFGKIVIQNLEGLRLIHTYHRHQKVLADAYSILNSISDTSKRLYLSSHSIPAINEITGVISVASVLICALFIFDPQNLSSSASYLFTFLVLAYRTANRIQVPIANFAAAAMYSGPIVRLTDLLKDEGKDYLPSSGKPFQRFIGNLEFQSVTLQYSEGKEPAIDRLSFTVPRGLITAIVGPSGGGKSSILDLIIRLYLPTGGKILADGKDIAEFDLESWRSVLGVVSQDSFIFNDTVEENIRFGEDKATHEQIVEAAKMAQAHEFIVNLSEGYQTKLGEKGYKLSGGQLQRISLARALLKNPQILILDEATSSLDSLTELAVHRALEQFSQDRTTLVIAHRLSTITNADQILFIEKGKLVEQGSHSELLARQGKYAELWKLQSQTSFTEIMSP
jgi:ATP-binding cassette subfamily B protein/subfamily B ATP-binding cassette protein MsbA